MEEQIATALSNCQRCETPLERGDLRCSICGQAAPKQSLGQQKVVVQVLRCTGCGAAIRYDPKRQAPSCTFCDSPVKVETIEDPMEQSGGYLPFTIDANAARNSLRHWLASLGWFRPSDLSSSAQLEELRPIWWVAWVFDADSYVSWTCDSNAGSGRSQWAPHSGQNQIRFDDILVSASRGLSEAEAMGITPGMDVSTSLPQPRGAEDATIEQFDVQRSQARAQVTAAIHNLAAHRIQSSHAPGKRFRKMQVSVILRRLITKRLSMPAYVMAYRYKQKLYRVVICGQNDKLVVGSAPYSYAKILLVIGIGIAVLLVVMGLIAAAAGV